MPFNKPMISHESTELGPIVPRSCRIVNGDPNKQVISYYTRTGPEPLEQVTAHSTTRLLLNMNGANNSTTFTDSGPNNYTMTRVGNPVISTAQYKFGGASGYFNGSSYLTRTLAGGLGATFTLEFWFYTNTFSGWLFNCRTNNVGEDGFDIRYDLYTTTYANGFFGPSTRLLSNDWNHVVIMRDSNNKMYRLVNGYVDATATVSNSFTGTNLYIGASAIWNTGYLTGYMDDFRISSAVLYPTNGTYQSLQNGAIVASYYRPTTDGQIIIGKTGSGTSTSYKMYASVKPNDNFWQYDSLILNFNGTNNASFFYDDSPNNWSTITSFNTAKTVTSTYKEGVSSVYFNGTTDYLMIPNDPFKFGTGNFTLEFWVNVGTQTKTYPYLMATSPYNSSGGFIIYLPGPGTSWGGVDRMVFMSSASGANGPDLTSTSTFKNQGWKHVAISRNGSTFKLFVNGIQEATATNSTANFTGVTGVNSWIGVAPSGTSGAFDGNTLTNCYMDMLRVTKGACRYTSNFTPPASYNYLKWKPVSPALTYYNTFTDQPYDSNWLLY